MKRLPLLASLLLAALLNIFSVLLTSSWPGNIFMPLGVLASATAAMHLVKRGQTSKTHKAVHYTAAGLIAVTLATFLWLSLSLIYRFQYDSRLQQDDLASLEWLVPFMAFTIHILSLFLATIVLGIAQVVTRLQAAPGNRVLNSL